MDANAFLLSLAALALGQSAPTAPNQPSGQEEAGPQSAEIRMGYDLRPLPFPLNLDRRARSPRSLSELVDRLYQALPQNRLDMFAAYYGGNDFERIRARFDSTIDFYRDLYTTEILYEASRIWGFSDAHFPLDRARRCVGEYFVQQVAIQIGARRLRERGNEGVPPPLRNTAGAYGMAAMISRQLFDRCDRLHSPRSRGR